MKGVGSALPDIFVLLHIRKLHFEGSMPAHSKRRKGKQAGRTTPMPSSGVSDAEDVVAVTSATLHREEDNDSMSLVLTSDKRRGVYECDYCHVDISQMPRIRCAVCPDFDLCLECFATTDHTAAVARLKAAATVHDALINAADPGSNNSNSSGVGRGKLAAGISMTAANHDETHGYRVCDSTRYPIFPSSRKVTSLSRVASLAGDQMEAILAEETKEEKFDDDASGVDDKNKASQESEKLPATENSPDCEMTENEHVKEIDSQSVKAEKSKKAVVAPDAASEKDITQETMETEVVEIDDGRFQSGVMMVQEDPKFMWTAEEDLRLLDAIMTCGLGNWADISEAIAGNGSSGKTPKRCMERYLDDYLGRYGHILPPYIIVDEDSEPEESADADAQPNKPSSDDEEVRFSKRRRLLTRSPSCVPAAQYGSSSWSRRKTKVVPTDSLPGYHDCWPIPYLPPVENVEIGQDVGRDQICKNEQAFVKAITGASAEEAEKIRNEWMETKLNKPGGLTVLPQRPEDVAKMPGAELAGFMPRRGDFDIEWENDAEQALADMEFSPADLPQDRQLKLHVLAIYNSKLDEREKRKKFLLSRNLYDYRKNQLEDQKLPLDERDLVRRMRLFERFHTPEEHKQFIADLLRAKRLRKEIAKLQMYRRMGIRTLAEAEKYELEKNRRQFHKAAHFKKEADAALAATQTAASAKESAGSSDEDSGVSLWKKYRTSDRKIRKSINRSGGNAAAHEGMEQMETNQFLDTKFAASKSQEDEQNNEPDKPQTEGEQQNEATNANSEVAERNSESIGSRQECELLSPKEGALCQKLELQPAQYLEVKRALITESLTRGLLDKESSVASRRTIVKIDVTKRGDVIDFMVRAGWISNKLGAAARSLPPAAAE